MVSGHRGWCGLSVLNHAGLGGGSDLVPVIIPVQRTEVHPVPEVTSNTERVTDGDVQVSDPTVDPENSPTDFFS